MSSWNGIPAPPGYDAARWASGDVSTDKYIFGREFAMWLNGRGGDPAAMPGRINATWWKFPEVLQLSNGDLIDVLFDFQGPRQHQQWTHVGSAPLGSVGPAPGPSGGGPTAPSYQAQQVSPRTEILNAANGGPTESSPQLALQQRYANYRASLTSGTSGESLNLGAVGMGAGAVQTISTRPATQPPPSSGSRGGGVRGFFGAIGRGLGAGVRAVGRGVRAAITSPIGATIAGVAAAAFVPGPVGAGVRSGLMALGTGARAVGSAALRGVRAAGRGVRGGIAAAVRGGPSGPSGSLSNPLLGGAVPGVAGTAIPAAFGQTAAAASRGSLGSFIGAGIQGFLGGGQQQQPPPIAVIPQQQPAQIPDVWNLETMLYIGQIPDPPFYMEMAGAVEIVVDVFLTEDGVPVFVLDPDGYMVSAMEIIEAGG